MCYKPTKKKRNTVAFFKIPRLQPQEELWENRNTYRDKARFQGKNAKGISNAGVARQITSGTSWLIKSPGIRNAVSRSKSQAEAAMQAKLESEIKKMTL